jgi:hypothetical protein
MAEVSGLDLEKHLEMLAPTNAGLTAFGNWQILACLYIKPPKAK